MFFLTSVETTNDWLWSGIPLRFPRLKIAIGEGGVGWLPALLDRLDYVTTRDPVNEWDPSKSWRRAGITPSEALLRNFWFMGSWDPTGFRLLDRIGADKIVVGTDYPHQDTTWPKCQDRIAGEVAGMSDEDVRKLTYANACDLYRFPLPSSN
jgi:predicted TIM-barrel fold metal-dependent hydrolase